MSIRCLLGIHDLDGKTRLYRKEPLPPIGTWWSGQTAGPCMCGDQECRRCRALIKVKCFGHQFPGASYN